MGSKQSSENRAHGRVASALRAFVSRGEVSEGRLLAASRKEEEDLLHALWDLPWDDRCLARFSVDAVRRFLAHVAGFDTPYLKAGALFGLEAACAVAENLPAFRTCATHSDWRVRDAAAFGLGSSLYARDERLLWTLFEDDERSDVRVSAAYSLERMARPIDAKRYRAALREMRNQATLLLAERARTDKRLYAYTRTVLKEKWLGLWRKHMVQGWFDHYPEAFGFSGGGGAAHRAKPGARRSRSLEP